MVIYATQKQSIPKSFSAQVVLSTSHVEMFHHLGRRREDWTMTASRSTYLDPAQFMDDRQIEWTAVAVCLCLACAYAPRLVSWSCQVGSSPNYDTRDSLCAEVWVTSDLLVMCQAGWRHGFCQKVEMPMFGIQSDRQLARDSHADSRQWTGWSLTKELLTWICVRSVWNLYRTGRESASVKQMGSTRTWGGA